jgi:hypothetical protein
MDMHSFFFSGEEEKSVTFVPENVGLILVYNILP